MKNTSPILIILLFAGFLIYSCDDSITASDIDSKVIPSANVSYQEYIQPLFTVKCAMSGCHDDRTQSGGVVLSSYGYATSNYAVVAPGNPTASKLVWAVEGIGARLMPPMGVVSPLNKNQIDGIKTWIKEGAKNN